MKPVLAIIVYPDAHQRTKRKKFVNGQFKFYLADTVTLCGTSLVSETYI